MIRKRPEAENTQRGIVPTNIYWELTKATEPCGYCGRIHDGAGRAVDERGKLMVQPARTDLDGQPRKCPLELASRETPNTRIPTPKINRMLGTLEERLYRAGVRRT